MTQSPPAGPGQQPAVSRRTLLSLGLTGAGVTALGATALATAEVASGHVSDRFQQEVQVR